jgi:hypothetical protein
MRQISLIVITVTALAFYGKASFAAVMTAHNEALSKQAVSTFSLAHGSVVVVTPKVTGSHGHFQGGHGHSQGGRGRGWWGSFFGGSCFSRCRQSHSPKYCHARCD